MIASNVRLARDIIKNKYSHLIRIRCIAHCLNLISSNIHLHRSKTGILKVMALTVKVTTMVKTEEMVMTSS